MLQTIISSKFLRKKFSTNLSDDFIKRLQASVIGEGMLHKGNIDLLDFVIAQLPSYGCIIEIGSYGGLSTNLICYLLNKHKKENPFFSCDAWVYEGFKDYTGIVEDYVDGRSDLSRKAYMNYIKQAFINACSFLNKNNLPKSYHLTSNQFFAEWSKKSLVTDVFGNNNNIGGDICFAYIDGDHSYKSVKEDFNNVNQFLVKGGYILFDDSQDGINMGSSIFMKEMKQNTSFKFIDKNPNYLFQKIIA
jgi:Methyltransferase domain